MMKYNKMKMQDKEKKRLKSWERTDPGKQERKGNFQVGTEGSAMLIAVQLAQEQVNELPKERQSVLAALAPCVEKFQHSIAYQVMIVYNSSLSILK